MDFGILGYILNGGPHPRWYNCGTRSQEEWYATGNPRPILAVYLLGSGTVFATVYILALIAMIRGKMYNISPCYVVMIFMGFSDLQMLGVSSFSSGILFWEGAVFCNYPRWIYLAGAIGLSSWCSGCLHCMVLGTMRVAEMGNNTFVSNRFSARNCFLIGIISLLLGYTAGLLTPSPVFNSLGGAWFTNPFIDNNEIYENWAHNMLNLFMSIYAIAVYLYICVRAWKKWGWAQGMSKTKKLLYIQAFIICSTHVGAAWGYLFMNYIPNFPKILSLVGEVAWQCSHGFPGMVYLILNKSIRKSVLKMLGLKKLFSDRWKIHVIITDSTKPTPDTTIRWLFGYPDSYYNCSGRSVAEWAKTGERWPLFGAYFLVSGTAYMCLYLPTIYAMIRLNMIKDSCYKIMLTLIGVDILNIIANSIIAGYLFSAGAVFCTNPVFMYIEGAYNIFVWMAASFFYVLLAINRFIVILGNSTLDYLFQKVPMSIWLFLCLVYCTYGAILHTPLPYSSPHLSAHYIISVEDPVTEIRKYENIVQQYHNPTVAALIAIFYSMIALIIIFRRSEEKKTSQAEMNALIQAFMITLPTLFACMLYVYVPMTNSNTLGWAVAAQLSWQTLSGISAIFYFIFNSRIRGFYFGTTRVSSIYEGSNGQNLV